MRALVVGYGSIGARHARLLTELGLRTAVVSKRAVDFPIVYNDILQALSCEQPEYVVIANTTNKHLETLTELASAGFNGVLLVEKPVFVQYATLPPNSFREGLVAYNLRFHPIIKRLRTLLSGERILSVLAYVGQFLPEWRPGRDYRATYSTDASQGGGALRDLSHEIDYLGWILGGWKRVAALGGHISQLEITSDDTFAILMETPRCPIVTLQLNYLDRDVRRFVLVNTDKYTIEADLVRGVIRFDGTSEKMLTERDDTYRTMHEAIIRNETQDMCTLYEGLSTLRLIEEAERSAKEGMWVKL
jgi:predicted dehydrogenase